MDSYCKVSSQRSPHLHGSPWLLAIIWMHCFLALKPGPYGFCQEDWYHSILVLLWCPAHWIRVWQYSFDYRGTVPIWTYIWWDIVHNILNVHLHYSIVGWIKVNLITHKYIYEWTILKQKCHEYKKLSNTTNLAVFSKGFQRLIDERNIVFIDI